MVPRSMRFSTGSEDETERFGERLGGLLGEGAIVGLVGPLGAGKTTLVRGIARGLGVDEGVVASPTFLTAAQYQGKLEVAHIDLYRHADRLPDPDWLAELLDGEGVALVEWFERLGDGARDDALRIEIEFGRLASERRFTLRALGPRSNAVLRALEGERAA